MNDHDKAILEAREWLTYNPLFLDTETTGLYSKDQVIEVAIVDKDGQELMNTLIKPTVEISYGATLIHGLTEEDVEKAPGFAEIWPKLYELTKGKHLVVYNLPFDITKIKQSLEAALSDWKQEEHPWRITGCDAMTLFAQYYGDWNDYHRSYTWKSLAFAAHHLAVEAKETHRALADAQLARLITLAMAASKTEEEKDEQPTGDPIPARD